MAVSFTPLSALLGPDRQKKISVNLISAPLYITESAPKKYSNFHRIACSRNIFGVLIIPHIGRERKKDRHGIFVLVLVRAEEGKSAGFEFQMRLSISGGGRGNSGVGWTFFLPLFPPPSTDAHFHILIIIPSPSFFLSLALLFPLEKTFFPPHFFFFPCQEYRGK